MSARTDEITRRARLANLTRKPATDAEINAILSPAYLAYVLDPNGVRPHVPA